MDPMDKYLAMDPMDKYLVIAKYLSIGSIGSIFFFYRTKYLSIGSIGTKYLSDVSIGSIFFFIELNTYPMYPSDHLFFYRTKYLSDVSIGPSFFFIELNTYPLYPSFLTITKSFPVYPSDPFFKRTLATKIFIASSERA